MQLKKQLDREKLMKKLRKHKINNRKKESIDEYIFKGLNIIKDDLKKYVPIENDKYVLSLRQKFVLEEFERNIKENKYEVAYYDLEDFISCEEVSLDKTNNKGFKYSKYISLKEYNDISTMLEMLTQYYNE